MVCLRRAIDITRLLGVVILYLLALVVVDRASRVASRGSSVVEVEERGCCSGLSSC